MSIQNITTAVNAFNLNEYRDACPMRRDEIAIDILEMAFAGNEADIADFIVYTNLLDEIGFMFSDRLMATVKRFKINCTASLVEAVAKDTNGDFEKLWGGPAILEAIGESIIDWVDNGGEHYNARLDTCKALFKNFSY